MFTGIIESLATVTGINIEGTNKTFTLQNELSADFKIDQSIAHDGVCLTVTGIDLSANSYQVTAIEETLLKSNLSGWAIGKKINIERSMMMNGRLDGHIVQGHTDQTGICTTIDEKEGSWYFRFEYDPTIDKNITVEKGSITINGVSLTVVDSLKNGFSVAIIPYTYQHTNFHQLKVGAKVNLEFDIIGKYIQKIMSQS
jgi:riboflavin synthase